MITDGRLTLEALALQVDKSEESIRRPLAGEQQAGLRDLVIWLMVAGSAGYATLPQHDDDLFPSVARPLLGQWRSGVGRVAEFRNTTEPSWLALASNLAEWASDVSTRGGSHLLTADSVRQRGGELLVEQGVPISRLRLDNTGGRCGLVVGARTATRLEVILVSDRDVDDASRAEAALRTIRGAVRREATSAAGQRTAVVVMSTSGLAADVAWEAVDAAFDADRPDLPGPRTFGSSAADADLPRVIGPFEPSDIDDEWWAGNEVHADVASRYPVGGAGAVIVLAGLKTVQI